MSPFPSPLYPGKCDRCGKSLPLVEGEPIHTIEVPVYSPTGYPEDASYEEQELCDSCYNIVTEGLDQDARLLSGAGHLFP